MKLVKPVTDFDVQSADGTLQYRLFQGTLKQQIDALRQGGFSWLSAPATRELIVDNPIIDINGTQIKLDNQWFRTGTEPDYTNQGKAILYFSPQNRIIQAGQAKYEFPLNAKDVKALVTNAKKQKSGIFTVDLETLAKNKLFTKDNDAWGHLAISTTDYEKQMTDDPNTAALVNAGYNPKGETLNRIMQGIRKRSNETWAFVLMPDYVKGKAAEGTGIGRLSTVYGSYYYLDSYFDAIRSDIVSYYAFVFGVRQAALGADAPKK